MATSERTEALMRLVVLVISGIILSLWKTLIQIIVVFHWLVVIITGERNKGLAEFCHIFNAQTYIFLKYITFASNKRPFPFEKLGKVDNPDFK